VKKLRALSPQVGLSRLRFREVNTTLPSGQFRTLSEAPGRDRNPWATGSLAACKIPTGGIRVPSSRDTSPLIAIQPPQREAVQD
jgi:hypothetical protein